MSKRKPLEPVRVVRAHAVDAAADKVRDAERSSARARGEADEKSHRARSVQDELTARARSEAAAVGSVRDLAQLEAFRVGADSAIARAKADADAAAKKAREEEARLAAERARLVDARAALDVVEKHQAAARTRADREAQEKLDEAAEDAFAARFGRRV